MTDIRDALLVGRTSDGKVVKRPLSPHLQIYRPQITAVSSICHRFTGVAVSLGTLLLVWWLVAAAQGPAAFARVQGFIASPIGLLLLFGWTLALLYHFFAGIRHLGWDMGYGFEKPTYHATGYGAFIAAGVATVLVWALGLALRA